MRIYPSSPVVSVGAVILDGDCVVLIKRGHAPLQGHWNLPGGVVELGETLQEAVAREVREETGLEVDVGPVVEVLERVERAADGRIEYHYVIVDYWCRPIGDCLETGSDADEARWVRIADLPQYQITDKATAVILKALQIRKSSNP